jgi:hypothetical protein
MSEEKADYRPADKMIKLNCDQCGKEYKRPRAHVRSVKHFCSRVCQGLWASVNRRGENAGHWKGGVRRDGKRIQWHLPWHHLACKKGYVYRYQIVAELKLGRKLRPGEVVHHLDENQSNDHPDNLRVYANQGEHALMHGIQRSPEQMAQMRAKRGEA